MHNENTDPRTPPSNSKVIPRAGLEELARQVDPRGLAAVIPLALRRVSMFLGLRAVPLEFTALGNALADPSAPLTITIAAGDAAPYVIRVE